MNKSFALNDNIKVEYAGKWYAAKIIGKHGKTLTVEYAVDGSTESNVTFIRVKQDKQTEKMVIAKTKVSKKNPKTNPKFDVAEVKASKKTKIDVNFAAAMAAAGIKPKPFVFETETKAAPKGKKVGAKA